ncbi:MAG: hypothetical protein JWN86_2355 [Planctomycetota bacterium]|nr:hypothetical protein [Planctomycetota bacterium]
MDLKNLSDAAVPDKAKAAPPEEKPFEPKVHGESTYDRVSSMLISVVVGTAMIVGWLWLVYFANQAYASPTPAAVEIVEVTGGGAPDGDITGTGEANPNAGEQTSSGTSNPSEDASGFDEPQDQATSTPVLDAMATNSDGEVSDGAVDTPRGGAVSMGPKGSRLGGNGIVGLGQGGPGSGGVTRAQRWVFVAPPGQTADDYARQLDYFKVELGTPGSGNTVKYASNFASAPITRTGLPANEKRLYISWQGQARKQFDIELMRKAGIDPGGPILQFFPPELTNNLAQMEVRFKGRQPIEIAQTRFTVQPAGGGGFAFVVMDQKSLR